MTSFQNIESSRGKTIKELLQVKGLRCCLNTHWALNLEALEIPKEDPPLPIPQRNSRPLCSFCQHPPIARTTDTPDCLRGKPVGKIGKIWT